MKKVSMRGIHNDVLEFQSRKQTLDEFFNDNEIFGQIEKEWKEMDLRRNILKELVWEKNVPKEIKVMADEKTRKKIYYMERRDTFDNIDVRDKMQTIPLKEYIEAQWWVTMRLNMCPCKLPGHKDRTASFKLYPHTNTFYCFGCHRGWTLLDFIMHNQELGKAEAIKIINHL